MLCHPYNKPTFKKQKALYLASNVITFNTFCYYINRASTVLFQTSLAVTGNAFHY